MKLRPQSPQTRVLFRHLRPSNHLLLGHLREDSIIGEPRPRTYQVGRLLYQQVVPTFRSNKRYNIIWYAKKLASMNTGSARPIERFFTEGLRRPGAAALCSWLGLFVRVSQFLFCLLARESSHSRILWETQSWKGKSFDQVILFIIITVSFFFGKLEIDWYEEAHRPRGAFTSRLSK